MSTGTLDNRLGEVKCQHRWGKARELPYPRTPTLTGWDELDSLGIEAASCRRCGSARLRYFDRERDFAVSSWSYAESMEHLILGRPLNEHERERMLAGLVLN